MTFLSITPQDTITNLVFNVLHRENEVNQYQINIDNYNHMLSMLPVGEPPEDIAPYVNANPENIPDTVPLDIVLKADEYTHRNRLSYLLRTENIEQAKAKRMLEAIKAQIPADQLDALVLEAMNVIKNQNPAA